MLTKLDFRASGNNVFFARMDNLLASYKQEKARKEVAESFGQKVPNADGLSTVQHDHKIWGEHVHVFKPDRFAEGVVKATNNNPVAFLPFGYGPQTCLGLNFAMIEAKISLSMILQRYMFTTSPTYVH
ncbi:hypothetical protein H5410_050188 [Solanum commersonii]|uniref:Cytochrome P450 n=1 Tax=Solanum commersonii TaxID=4109 RepID=A0A9J5WUR9_SOLCO|nr:hypothetical protein H5410_050188 [Solanum commersonii]